MPSTRSPNRLDKLTFKATERLWYPLEDRQRQLAERIRNGWLSKGTAQQHEQAVNQKAIRVVGMRRTGNHALITWMERQQPGTVYHLNNVAAKANPYRYKSDNLRRYHPEHSKMAEVYRRQAKGEFVQRDCLIYSYEDWSLKEIAAPRFERNRSLYLGKSDRHLDVLILRDPFNLFASRLKQNFVDTKAKSLSMVELWLEYAKEFVGDGKSRYLSEDLVCANYNQWFADQDYRRRLAEQLGLEFSDAGLSFVPKMGEGSSFDGTTFSGQARQMDVTNRWKVFADEPKFRQLFENPEVWHYSEQIFGHLPGTEVLKG